MVGDEVTVWTKLNHRYTYRVIEVRRFQKTLVWAFRLPPNSLVLQTSEDQYRAGTKVMVVARQVGDPVLAPGAEANPPRSRGSAAADRRLCLRATLAGDDEHPRRRKLPLHVRVGHRGPPGQDVRPDLGRDPRRDPARGPRGPGGVRDRHHDRARGGPRGDHDEHLRRLPGRHPGHGPRDRLHEGRVRVRLPDLRGAGERQGAVARHRPRRGRGGAGGRRPGDDVRLRLPRDARADAPADRPRPPYGASPGRGRASRASCPTCARTARPR